MGRTGFSTVARSRNMPEKLAAAVERCGIYDIEVGEIFSHRIIQYAGKNWHILTRMKDAGVDYTNRNNYIAHHVVLNDSEVEGLANPAEILAQWSGWVSEWKREPALIEDAEGLSTIKAKNKLPAKTWEAHFGNPSKAALLFNDSAYILASPQNARVLLDLFSESCLLNVNPIDAWSNTFTTSFAKGENPADFMWKAVASGENASINLSAKFAPSVSDSRAAQYAVSGELNNVERLNLKVKAPVVAAKFKVAKNVEPEKSNKKIYVISGIASVAIILIGLLFATTSTEEQSFETDKSEALPVLQATATETVEQPQPQRISLLDTMNDARAKIEKDEYAKALEVWDSSPFATENPSLRKDLLADIGARVDSLLRTAESEISINPKSEIAKSNLEKARRALETKGIDRKERRFIKWKNLNDKINK